jgi:hypothetical protein
MVAAKPASVCHGEQRISDQAANLPLDRQSQAAEMLNVSDRSLRRVPNPLDMARLPVPA